MNREGKRTTEWEWRPAKRMRFLDVQSEDLAQTSCSAEDLFQESLEELERYDYLLAHPLLARMPCISRYVNWTIGLYSVLLLFCSFIVIM